MEDVEVKEYHPEDHDPYSVEKLFGVAILGALVGMAGYYIFHALSNETKETLKETLAAAFRAALAPSKEP